MGNLLPPLFSGAVNHIGMVVMKTIVTLASLALAHAASGSAHGAQSSLQPGGQTSERWVEASFAGQFAGKVGDAQAVVELEREDDEIYGEILADGYLYLLIATMVGEGQAQGELYDPQTNATMPAEVTHQGVQLNIRLVVNGQPVALQFNRGSSAPEVATSPASPAPEAMPEGNRDPALIGAWSYQDVMTGGGMSVATILHMQVGADGRYSYGNARTMASGADFGGDTGTGGADTGAWRTENNVIFVHPDGTAQWVPYARYEVSGNRLLLVFNDGTRQLWHRN